MSKQKKTTDHDPLKGLDPQGVIRKNPDGSEYAMQQFDHRFPSGLPNQPVVPLDEAELEAARKAVTGEDTEAPAEQAQEQQAEQHTPLDVEKQ